MPSKRDVPCTGFIPMGIAILLLCSCHLERDRGSGDTPPLFSKPDTVLLNTDQGYTVDIFGDSIPPFIYRGDTVKTGIPVLLSGRIIDPDGLPPPKIVPAGQPRRLTLNENVHSLPARMQTSAFDERNLLRFAPGSDTASLVLTTSVGDTIRTGIAIPIQGLKVPARHPRPVSALRPQMRYNALYDIQCLDVDHGMNNSRVNCILQDKSGSLWFGTYIGGLTRYDGATFTHYTTKEGLTNDYITALIEDKNGVLWIGTHGGGICSFDGVTFVYFRESEGLSSNFINCLFEDSTGSIWMGTRNRGVSRFDPAEGEQGTITHYATREGFRGLNISSISEDRNGHLWFTTGAMGAIRMSPVLNGLPAAISYLSDRDGLLSNTIHTIFEDSQGRLWFGTNAGVSCLDDMSFIHFTSSEGFPHNVVRTIHEDRHGNLWFGTGGGGACYFDGKSFTIISEAEGLSSNIIASIVEDTTGNLWLGTFDAGVCRYKPSSFVHYFTTADLTRPQAIHEDRNGNLWIATLGNGVLKYIPPFNGQHGDLLQYTTRQGLSDNQIWSIEEDMKGNLWFGTWRNGVNKFDGSTFTHYQRQNGLSANDIRSIVEDRHGNLWFGTHEGGVTCLLQDLLYDKSKFVQFTLREGLLATTIRKVFEDSRGAIWLGTLEKGMIRLEPQYEADKVAATYFSRREGLIVPFVNDISEDAHGHLWLAMGRGVTRFNIQQNDRPGQFVHFTEKAGLADSYTRSVRADHHGNIWVSTSSGLSQIRVSDSRMFSFHKAEGLKGSEFEFGSACIDSRNRLWWGSDKGIETLDAHLFRLSSAVPQPQLRRVEINGEFLDYRNLPDSLRGHMIYSSVPSFENYPLDLALPYSKDHLTFYFSAIDWAAPSKIRYSYIIDGLHDSWSPPSPETKAEYRSLSPGHYTFKVRAVGESQQWSYPFEYSFSILPPWWLTWWAYTMYGLTGLGIVYAIYRFQLKRKLEIAEKHRLLELDELKNKLYTNITHEFRTPLTLIHGPLAHSLSSHEPLDEKDMHSMYVQSKRLQQLITQMLDLQKAEAGKLTPSYVYGNIIDFVRYLFEAFGSYAREKGIDLRFSASQQNLLMDYDEEKLTQIVSNLVSNAMRHTPVGGTVSLELHTSDNMFHMHLHDTGTGIGAQELPFIFDRYYQSSRAAQGGTGIGLALVKSLVELLRGSILVESKTDQGTRFSVSFPMTNFAQGRSPAYNHGNMPILNSTDDEVRFSPPPSVLSDKPIVLIVEDHSEVAQFIASCLKKDFSTMIAADGDEGIKIAFDLIPDLVISDVMMPGKSGFELCATLKMDIQTSHIPVILLTGRGDHLALMEGIEHGADAYVVKPFEPAELLLRVKKLLELRKSLSEHYRSIAPASDGKINKHASAKEHAFLAKVRSFIEEHISDPQFNMHMLCQHMAMSHPQLHRKITALTGESTGKFVRSVRLTKAIELLKASDLTVSEIAYETGFSEPGYFTKVFSKEYHMTPTEYRAHV